MPQKKTSEELYPSDFVRLAKEFAAKQVYVDKAPIKGDHDKIVSYLAHKLNQTKTNQRLLEAGAINKEKKPNVRRVKYQSKTDRRKEIKFLREELRKYTEGLNKDGGDGGTGDSLPNSGTITTVLEPREEVWSDTPGVEGVDRQSNVTREDDSRDEEK